jgi:RNA polymerase sigma-70 factor (ECF subfamily)
MKTMQPADIEMLRSAQQLDAVTLARIYEEYSPAVYRYAYHLLGSLQTSEDCVSDTFLGFLSKLEAGKGPRENIKAYLFRSAHNWIVDFYRNKGNQNISLNEDFLDSNSSVELEAEKRIRLGETIKALTRLTLEQKEVILLRFSEGLDIREISRIVHKSPGAIKALLHRAINTLQKELKYEEK